MRTVLALLFTVALAAPVLAKPITITLDDEEQKVFLALLDGALKSGGLANLQAVIKFVQKYQAAVGPAVNAPVPAKPEEKK